ncbi:MAG: SnoaL-like domain-containing protein [Bacteroidota bacterium]
MNIKVISSRLVDLLRNKDFLAAQEELFDVKVINVEPDFHPREKTEGITNLLKKEKAFLETIKMWYDLEVSDPIISQQYFSICMYSRLLMKNGHQLEIDEIIVYQVANNKIVKEQFFYTKPE